MSTISYILPEKNVGALAQAVALQQGSIYLRKDNESTFFIADIDSQITIPENIRALKMNQQLLIGEIVQETKESSANHDQLSTSTNLPAKIEEHNSNNFLELVIRLKFDEKPDKRKLTQIYEEVTKAISGVIQKLRGDNEK